MYFPDLGTECMLDKGPYVRAVGWLSSDHPFTTGDVPREFLNALKEHLRDPWQPSAYAGRHDCEFCPPNRKGCFDDGVRNLWIPGDGVLYIAPEMIVHYIETHGYCPPEEFMEAVLNCPEQQSPAFLDRIIQLNTWWSE
jgi:hypothetical protein